MQNYQTLRRLYGSFWKWFYKKYLASLGQHYHEKASGEHQVGDPVLIQDQRRPRMEWPMGVIPELLTGPDDVTRVVTLRAPDGTELLRALKTLIPLEADNARVTWGGSMLQIELLSPYSNCSTIPGGYLLPTILPLKGD